MNHTARAFEYWFASIPGLTDEKKILLRSCMKSGEAIYYIEETELGRMQFLNETDRNTIMQEQKKRDPKEEWARVADSGIWMNLSFEETYPARLSCISDKPYALYGKGNLPKDKEPSAAIVGARACTAYGEACARWFAEEMVKNGIQIISGMARGIDGSAQRGALTGGGTTYAVLGNGVDICYPREHIGLYTDILAHGGGILSEQPPKTKPFAWNFPRRNRIISALSDVVLVMEAKEKSGSLITADLALEQGKDVYALPGPVGSPLSRGCHFLIRQGAGILISPEELCLDLGIVEKEEKRGKKTETQKVLETKEDLVYSSFGVSPKSVGQIVEEIELPPSEIIGILTMLEMKGYIREKAKNYYVRCGEGARVCGE